jgi:hypothetical protein
MDLRFLLQGIKIGEVGDMGKVKDSDLDTCRLPGITTEPS